MTEIATGGLVENRFYLLFLSNNWNSTLASVEPCVLTVRTLCVFLKCPLSGERTGLLRKGVYFYAQNVTRLGKGNPVTQEDEIVGCIAVCKSVMANNLRVYKLNI